jgi:hypothetical protein
MEAKKFTQVLLSVLLIILINFNLKAQTFAYGNYTGNGTSKSISGLGFSPEAIIIKSQGAYEAVFTTTHMPAGKTKGLGTTATALISGEVTALNSDGFTIASGNRTNNFGTQYQWIAFNEGTNIHIGTYVGDGSPTAEVISGCGFQPEAVLLCGDAASAAADPGFLLNSMGAGSDDGFFTCNTSTTASADYVVSYGADGWTTGTGPTSPILSAVNYYYIAFNVSASTIKDGSYTSGDGTTDKAITGLGGSANFVAIWRRAQTPVFRTAGITAASDKTLYYSATAAAASRIKSLDADGFTVAANNNLTNEPWQVHNYFAMAGGTSLPVQMTSFEAAKDGKNVVLTWQTASEINSSYFNILHSTDGINFQSVGKISAEGTSNEWLNYSFTHENAAEGVNYYQLQEYDNDGANTKYKIIDVNINNGINAITQLSPNPSSNNILLYYNSNTGGTYKLTITDMNGNAQYFAHIPSMIGENKFKMTLQPYEEGTYFINLTDPAGVVSSVKVIKKE